MAAPQHHCSHDRAVLTLHTQRHEIGVSRSFYVLFKNKKSSLLPPLLQALVLLVLVLPLDGNLPGISVVFSRSDT